MSAIRSKANKTTELSVISVLKELKITGWRRHLKNIYGKPDIVFLNSKTALFIDGCFWHGCAKHGTVPKSNTEFWAVKISQNKKRDKLVNKTLKLKGWKIIRIWEHDSKSKPKLVRLLKKQFHDPSPV